MRYIKNIKLFIKNILLKYTRKLISWSAKWKILWMTKIFCFTKIKFCERAPKLRNPKYLVPLSYKSHPAKLLKHTHLRSVFLFNQHSKCNAVLSKIHFSRQFFQQFCRLRYYELVIKLLAHKFRTLHKFCCLQHILFLITMV